MMLRGREHPASQANKPLQKFILYWILILYFKQMKDVKFFYTFILM